MQNFTTPTAYHQIARSMPRNMLSSRCRSSRSLSRRQAGFTLLELLLVLAILVVIGGIALPNFLGAGQEAKANADERKARRKQAIIRTTMRWQNNLRHHFFSQWKGTCAALKKQRKSLLGHFQKAHEKSVGDVFKAWHTWLVSTRLDRYMHERENLTMKERKRSLD